MAREMKDSGVAWIGEIPVEWKIGKVKRFYKMTTGFTPDTKNQLFYDDNGYEWVNIADIQDGKTIWTTKNKISKLYIDTFHPQITPAGSLLYSFKLSVGQTAFAGKALYTNEAIASFLLSKKVNLRYLRYSSIFIIENAQTNIYNAKILNQELIRNALIIYPPLNEQAQIADYLDKKCAEIDTVLDKTRISIEEYKKLKQAIITRAVTKGVRGDRPMEESGIEWVPMIPADWSSYRGKHLFYETNERSETGSEELLTVSHKTGITPRSQKNVNMFMSESLVGYKICREGDIAANTMWMWQGAIGVSAYHGVISPSYNTYRQRNGVFDSQYLDYLLRIQPLVEQYNVCSTGITASRLRLYPEQFLSIRFVVPPMEEQQEIVKFLHSRVNEMDTIIQKKEQFLTELENYKKSLIYEYVTGKKGV